MRGDLQAAGLGSLPRAPRRRWSQWIGTLRRNRRQAQLRRLEVIERMAAEQRQARRRGEHNPALTTPRHWS
jgi:hypothetical protein